ncbi:glycosyltransferase family 4 protein [Nesterenkonia xinjiangensis]|uniref:Glycosyltransferase involved in cell wall biosynthesis n=1 Tax=Nesterenkonia xinjiangensis TaxID=225327 RepID=A0A7Z0GJ57_9MICC|nr:glycosyltransferase family 4 protein [Nesterenkonia xinjiangensis]NYJ76952.1 glycosyltransferase involved in cell wall biosynthesis [Nesterenkonia xinjiangensis]
MPESTTPVVGYVLKMYPRFSETFVVSEILAREAQGEQIVIFSLRPTTDSRFHPELARVQAPVIHVPRPSSATRLWDALSSGPASGVAAAWEELRRHSHDDAAQAVAVARLAREHGVTHLHAHFASVATTVARLAGRIAGLPYSFTAHAKDIFHQDVDPTDLEAKLADAHHAITISEYNLADLRRRFPQATGTLHLVRNGLELERFPFTPDRPQATDVPPRLLAVGRLVEKKGFRLLIEAVDVLRSRDLDVSADIAGDGPLAEELAAEITLRGLDDRIRLLGPLTQAELSKRLGTDDVFVAPFVVGTDGNADGLPTVLLEAMARGIRCVAADVTAVGEVVVPGETGWLVPSDDAPALADAIQEAVAEASAEGQMVRRARALVEELFASRRQAAALRALVPVERPSVSAGGAR